MRYVYRKVIMKFNKKVLIVLCLLVAELCGFEGLGTGMMRVFNSDLVHGLKAIARWTRQEREQRGIVLSDEIEEQLQLYNAGHK
jgi:hypothetical protein